MIRWFIYSLFAGLLACATSPEGRSQLLLIPDEQMAQLGEQGFSELKQKMTIERDVKTNAYVQCVARAILSVADPDNSDWEIVVFKESSANAFALPGRRIGVHTGLLVVAKTPGQLAAVLGHEVGHVLAKHSAERASTAMLSQGGLAALSVALANNEAPKNQMLMAALSMGMQLGVALPHSRTQETEADLIGLRLMSKAGFNPAESVNLWRNMLRAAGGAPPEWLSTHPASERRIETLQAHLPEVTPVFNTTSNRPNC